MEIIIPIAAVIILWLLFSWSIKVFKASVKTLLAIAAIVILLQVVFDVTSEQIIQESIDLIHRLGQLIWRE